MSETDWPAAVISQCGVYRYELRRNIGSLFTRSTRVCFVMLNPSTADGHHDDPTIRRCMGYARSWGHSELVVVNLFGYRATDPRQLTEAHARGVDVVGPSNDHHIRTACRGVAVVVCAWGARGGLLGRDAAVLRMLRALDRQGGPAVCALRLTKAGAPSHPLYLPAALTPVPWRPDD